VAYEAMVIPMVIVAFFAEWSADGQHGQGEKKELLTTVVGRAKSVLFFTTSGFWHWATWTQLA
jgi:hypothetical protein